MTANTGSQVRAALSCTKLFRPCLLLLALFVGCSGVSAASEASAGSPVVVKILVYNYVQAPGRVVTAAEHEASKILGAAGTQVQWVSCAPVSSADEACRGGWTKQTPGLRLIAGTNKFQDAQFGYAAIPVLVTIYYEKVARRMHRENAEPEIGVFLGGVIAHELGHLLLEDPKHSEAGIMQPEWGHAQMQLVLKRGLLFNGQQANRIRQHIVALADLDVDAAAKRINVDGSTTADKPGADDTAAGQIL
jgi:hypothetical protein